MKAKAKITGKRAAGVTEGSGNVFADLGISNPEQELLKAKLTSHIHKILKSSYMKRVDISRILGLRKPQVSLLMRNRVGNFPVGRLIELLTALGQDVEIIVRPTCNEHGTMSVIAD
jgi:predicted XRE-type DNA-binding protein